MYPYAIFVLISASCSPCYLYGARYAFYNYAANLLTTDTKLK